MKFQFRLSVNNRLISVIPCSSALSVAGLTESGEKMRVGRLAGILGAVGLADALAPVGKTTSVVLGAASGSVSVSDALVLEIGASMRLVAVTKENCELVGADGDEDALTVLSSVGTLELPDGKSDELGADKTVPLPPEPVPELTDVAVALEVPPEVILPGLDDVPDSLEVCEGGSTVGTTVGGALPDWDESVGDDEGLLGIGRIEGILILIGGRTPPPVVVGGALFEGDCEGGAFGG